MDIFDKLKFHTFPGIIDKYTPKWLKNLLNAFLIISPSSFVIANIFNFYHLKLGNFFLILSLIFIITTLVIFGINVKKIFKSESHLKPFSKKSFFGIDKAKFDDEMKNRIEKESRNEKNTVNIEYLNQLIADFSSKEDNSIKGFFYTGAIFVFLFQPWIAKLTEKLFEFLIKPDLSNAFIWTLTWMVLLLVITFFIVLPIKGIYLGFNKDFLSRNALIKYLKAIRAELLKNN